MRVKVSLKVTTYVSPLLFLNIAWTLDNVKVFLVIFLVDRPQRKRKLRSAIGLFKLLASYCGSQFVF